MVYKPVYQANVSKDSVKEDPEYLGLDFSVGKVLDSVGSDETDETGDEGFANVRTKSKGGYHNEEDNNAYLNFQSGC